jgi:hypothetical protein
MSAGAVALGVARVWPGHRVCEGPARLCRNAARDHRGADTAAPRSGDVDAGVEQCVAEVNDDVGHHDEHRSDQREANDHRQVALFDGLY